MDSVNKDGMVKLLKGCGAYKTIVRNVYNILHKTGRKHRKDILLVKRTRVRKRIN